MNSNGIAFARGRVAHHKDFQEKLANDEKELDAERNDAVARRNSASRKSMNAINGPVEIFCGAFIHAQRLDWGVDSCGVVVAMTPEKIDLSAPGSHWSERINAAKHEVQLLDETEWETVEKALRRRRAEYDEAERNGKTGSLADYSKIPVKVDT